MRSFDDILMEIASKETRMIRKIIIFLGLLTEDYEYRVAYFTDAMEAIMWENEMKKIYSDQRFRHVIKTDYIDIKKEKITHE